MRINTTNATGSSNQTVRIEPQDEGKKDSKEDEKLKPFTTQIKAVIDTLEEETSKRLCYDRSLKKYKIAQLKELSGAIKQANQLEEAGKLVKSNLMDPRLISGKNSRTKVMLEGLFNIIKTELSEFKIIKIETSAQIEAHINKLKEEVSNYFKYNPSLKEYKITKLTTLLEKIDSSSDFDLDLDLEELAEPLKQNLKDLKLIAGRFSRTKLLLKNLLHKVEQTIYKTECINLPLFCTADVLNDLEKCGTIDFKKLYDKLEHYKLIKGDYFPSSVQRLKPWMICFLSGNDELIQNYLNNNFDKNEINIDEDAPLHIALLGGSTKARQYVIKHLKDLGIDDPAQNFDQSDNNILIYAQLSCSAKALKYAKKFFKNFSDNERLDVITKAFDHAAKHNSVEVMEFLVNGSIFDPKNNKYVVHQAFFQATVHNAVDAMKFLVNGSIFDPKNNKYVVHQAFFQATVHNAVDAMEFLVELGVDPNSTNNINNQNVLHLIAQHAHQIGRCSKEYFIIRNKNLTETLLFIKRTCNISPYTKDKNGSDAFFYCGDFDWLKQTMRQVYPDDPSIDIA